MKEKVNGKRCDRCQQLFNKFDVIGANLFRYTETSTEHISTLYFCVQCAHLTLLK